MKLKKALSMLIAAAIIGTLPAALPNIKTEAAENSEAEVTKYSYEITPMLAPFNDYFYVKTDYPDPLNIRFVDKNSKYAEEGGTGTPFNYVVGDVNMDGKINMKDLVYLQRYLNHYEEYGYVDLELGDTMKDNKINLKDLIQLQRHLNKWNVTLG